MKTSTFIVGTCILTVLACNSPSTETSTIEKENELLKKELELAKKEMELDKRESQKATTSFTSKQSPPSQNTSDLHIHSNPETVVMQIFKAAKTGELNTLSNLCDPQGESDGDTKNLCGMVSREDEAKAAFRSMFINGKINGAAEIDGNEAKVKILFGPKGDMEETFRLIKRIDSWYLSSY